MQAVESVVSPIRPGGGEPVLIPDVRDVPLGDLALDADVRQIVRSVMGSLEDPSRVRVAMFNSAI
jgi:FXSXX-COOH protein